MVVKILPLQLFGLQFDTSWRPLLHVTPCCLLFVSNKTSIKTKYQKNLREKNTDTEYRSISGAAAECTVSNTQMTIIISVTTLWELYYIGHIHVYVCFVK